MEPIPDTSESFMVDRDFRDGSDREELFRRCQPRDAVKMATRFEQDERSLSTCPRTLPLNLFFTEIDVC